MALEIKDLQLEVEGIKALIKLNHESSERMHRLFNKLTGDVAKLRMKITEEIEQGGRYFMVLVSELQKQSNELFQLESQKNLDEICALRDSTAGDSSELSCFFSSAIRFILTSAFSLLLSSKHPSPTDKLKEHIDALEKLMDDLMKLSEQGQEQD